MSKDKLTTENSFDYADPEKRRAPELGAATGCTAPSAIPSDVARKIIAARDALIRKDIDEAWHQLYSIADPRFESYTPWARIEAQRNDKAQPRPSA